MNLSTLLRELPTYEVQNPHNVEITHITSDSRKVNPGALFVAYPGVGVNGAQFIADAVKRGAIAVICEPNQTSFHPPKNIPAIVVPNGRTALAQLSAAWHDFPSRKLRVIGVTGTDGKTTTCYLTASILDKAGHKVGVITTIGARIGDQEMDTGFHTTTPDAPEIQHYLAQMVDAGVHYAIIEATSHGLAQHRLDAIDFDIAVLTNITHEHLDLHKTWDNYRDAKAILFRSLTTSRRKPRTAKVSVLNADDDPRAFEYLSKIEADEHIVYSTGATRRLGESAIHLNVRAAKPPADAAHEVEGPNPQNPSIIYAKHITSTLLGLSFALATPFGELPISSPLLGRYNVSNILAAAGVAIARRVPFAAMREGIAHMRGVPGRMQVIRPFDSDVDAYPFTTIVDFAHTPNALRVALETAREISREHVIVMFGCAGLRDVEKRQLMGEVAGKLADKIIVTAEDPRTESLDAINQQIADGLELAGRRKGEDYFVVNDRAEAISQAVNMAQPGDVVLIAGKGHERTMCFGTTEYPWSDEEAITAALDRTIK